MTALDRSAEWDDLRRRYLAPREDRPARTFSGSRR